MCHLTKSINKTTDCYFALDLVETLLFASSFCRTMSAGVAELLRNQIISLSSISCPQVGMATSSLAAQLSKSVSLNASLYVDRSRRKPTESYLFTSREAEQHDFHSLYALGVNGITRLKTLDPKFAKYEATLFSDSSRDLDRTLQSEAQNIELDKMLYHFLRDLGPYLLETPTGKVLEWVVRRFR